jgi:hypothetical protein
LLAVERVVDFLEAVVVQVDTELLLALLVVVQVLNPKQLLFLLLTTQLL